MTNLTINGKKRHVHTYHKNIGVCVDCGEVIKTPKMNKGMDWAKRCFHLAIRRPDLHPQDKCHCEGCEIEEVHVAHRLDAIRETEEMEEAQK